MNKKSANQGDRLKHALLLEVLEGSGAWPDVTYAETHAGAGIYRAEGQATQKPREQYIRLLREEVEQSHLAEGDEGPGVAYLRWLKEWWAVPSKAGTYPGSALTVLRWLQKHHPERFEIRLTEGCEATCTKLKDALGEAYRDQAKHGSFHDHLDWLTEADNLVLMVDPFGIITTFGQGPRDRGMGEGQIDHNVVKKILDRCAQKERAIVHFWWSAGQNYKYYREANTCLFEDWRSGQKEVTHREFHDNHAHRSTLLGFGAAAGIVDGLPGRKRWEKSWLKTVIYEKRRSRTK